ncbi:gastrokine-2-like [Dendropsophus ebraccatus]|uniref:gastrokine-2-like n=1 Tax=Dendropsophus ebraccatus TaxID=150705 RepID=UPI003831B796
MEKKIAEQLDIMLPIYKGQGPLSRKWWIMGIGLVVLLIGIIAAATLIGVYMTQKHEEKMVTLILSARDKTKPQQTISTNERENMATVSVSGKNNSATALYDYRRNLIGIRKMNSKVCYVLKLDRSQTPSIQDILRQMDNARTQNASSNTQFTYSIIPERRADPTDVGVSVNTLCSDADIYWAKLVTREDVGLLGLTLTFTFAFSISIGI